MKYMLMMNAVRDAPQTIADWAPEDFARHIRFMKKLNADLVANGELVDAQGLAMPDDARVVRSAPDGTPIVTDGPFAEAKEFLVGYWIVETDTLERMYEIAAEASSAPGPDGEPMHMAIEIRQVMAVSPPVDAY